MEPAAALMALETRERAVSGSKVSSGRCPPPSAGDSSCARECSGPAFSLSLSLYGRQEQTSEAKLGLTELGSGLKSGAGSERDYRIRHRRIEESPHGTAVRSRGLRGRGRPRPLGVPPAPSAVSPRKAGESKASGIGQEATRTNRLANAPLPDVGAFMPVDIWRIPVSGVPRNLCFVALWAT